MSFPAGFQVTASNASINATTIEFAAEIPAFFVLGNASVFPRVVTVRAEIPRPIEFRLSPTNADRGRNAGGDAEFTPAERRAQFDLDRKIRASSRIYNVDRGRTVPQGFKVPLLAVRPPRVTNVTPRTLDSSPAGG